MDTQMTNNTIKQIFALKANLLKLFEKNNSVLDVSESFKACDTELTTLGFQLINSQNNLLIEDMEIKMYLYNLDGKEIIFFVILSHATNSMFFPISIEKNCPQGLLNLSKMILDKSIYKKKKI